MQSSTRSNMHNTRRLGQPLRGCGDGISTTAWDCCFHGAARWLSSKWGESPFPRMANHRLGSTYRWRTTSHGIADCRSCLGIESFLSWINLISERYAREIHEATTHTYPIKREMLDPDQQARGQRLLSFLRQSFAGYSKAEGIIAHYVATNREGEAHGFEAIPPYQP